MLPLLKLLQGTIGNGVFWLEMTLRSCLYFDFLMLDFLSSERLVIPSKTTRLSSHRLNSHSRVLVFFLDSGRKLAFLVGLDVWFGSSLRATRAHSRACWWCGFSAKGLLVQTALGAGSVRKEQALTVREYTFAHQRVSTMRGIGVSRSSAKAPRKAWVQDPRDSHYSCTDTSQFWSRSFQSALGVLRLFRKLRLSSWRCQVYLV